MLIHSNTPTSEFIAALRDQAVADARPAAFIGQIDSLARLDDVADDADIVDDLREAQSALSDALRALLACFPAKADMVEIEEAQRALDRHGDS